MVRVLTGSFVFLLLLIGDKITLVLLLQTVTQMKTILSVLQSYCPQQTRLISRLFTIDFLPVHVFPSPVKPGLQEQRYDPSVF